MIPTMSSDGGHHGLLVNIVVTATVYAVIKRYPSRRDLLIMITKKGYRLDDIKVS